MKFLNTKEQESTVTIFVCFLLTSTAWLSWEYHILEQALPVPSELLTMGIGYLLQAAGIGVFALLARYRKPLADRIFPVALAAHLLCLIPAALSPYPAGSLAFGFLMNLACGVIAGYYLYDLTRKVPAERTATVFSTGYGLAILASWLLTLAGGRSVYNSAKIVIICIALTTAALAADRLFCKKEEPGRVEASASSGPGNAKAAASSDLASAEATTSSGPANAEAATPSGSGKAKRRAAGKELLWLLCVLVLLFSLVNSSGFAFPAADLGKAVNLELSRLVYAAGLIIAGFVTDRNRKHGAICALMALVIPFIILALQGETLPAIVFWVLSYFTFGFYSVYRVILFSDYAAERDMLFLSGFGLMLGRVGDALGEMICIALAGLLPVQIAVTAILFAAATVVFFKVYNVLYVPETERVLSEREKFHYFAMEHDLSAREQDMLRLLLEQKTNSEIAGALFISENTVKFHIKNLLQKTGCKNRKELVAAYMAYSAEG